MLSLLKDNRVFRLFLAYRVFSGLGGGIFSIFVLLSVHLLYQNPIYTGIAGFLVVVPQIFSFAVGPIVDRKSKVSIMRITTLLEFAILTLLVIVPFEGGFNVIFLFVVVLIYSTAALFEGPAGVALLPQIVDEKKILQANSLIQVASMVGGIVIAAFLLGLLGNPETENLRVVYGVSAVFIAIAFIFTLFIKDPIGIAANDKKPDYRADLKAGAKFLRQSVLLFILMIIVARVFFAEIAYINLPMFAETHAGAQGYILIMVMALVGGILASVIVGRFGNKFKVGRLLFALTVLAGVGRIAFALFLPYSVVIGLSISLVYSVILSSYGIIIQSLIQKIPPKDMVGRVDTLIATSVAIVIAIGALAGGYIGSIVPVVDNIFIAQGAVLLVIGIFAILVPGIRALPSMNDITKSSNADSTIVDDAQEV